MTDRQTELLDHVYLWSVGAREYPSEWGELMTHLRCTDAEERWLRDRKHGQELVSP